VSNRAPIPNLPPISSIKDPDVRVALESMWNAWRVRNGDVGNGEHKFLTGADIKEALTKSTIIRGGAGALGYETSREDGLPNTEWIKPLLTAIDDYIQQSWLWKTLGERIEWIDTPEWFIDRFDRSFGTAIKNEEIIRQAADSSLASSITTVSAVLNDNIAVVREELTANVTLTEATATRVTTLQTEFDANKSQVQNSISTLTSKDQALTTQINQAISDFNGQISGVQTQIQTVSNSVSALSQSTTTNFTNVNNNLSLIETDVQAVTDLAGSNASKITTLQTSVAGAQTSAQSALTLASTTEGKVNGAWTVKFDATGYVTGAGLGLEGKNGTFSSSFFVRADRFSVGNPQYANVAPAIPFKIFTTTQNINGMSVSPGVYIDSAVIANGTIETAKIGNAQITAAKIGDLQVNTLKIGNNAVTIPVSQLYVGAVGGNGGNQTVNWLSYNMTYTGSVLVIFNGRQNYDSGARITQANIAIDGGLVTSHSIAGAINDYVTIAWSGTLSAGNHVIQVEWYGQDGSVRISNRSLTVLGTLR
jgi:phage shock protein A